MEAAFLVGFNIHKPQICVFQPSVIQLELPKPDEKCFKFKAQRLHGTTSSQGHFLLPHSRNGAAFPVLTLTLHL